MWEFSMFRAPNLGPCQTAVTISEIRNHPPTCNQLALGKLTWILRAPAYNRLFISEEENDLSTELFFSLIGMKIFFISALSPFLCLVTSVVCKSSHDGVHSFKSPWSLQTDCVAPKLICWNPNARCDGIRRWGVLEVIRSWGLHSLWLGLVPL